ncbi:MAG: hypothetical protein FWF44_10800, partial [Defluviitaleaceae bacterium]|nr:hypothetical protein [Defluviitaleaceae bacterium]
MRISYRDKGRIKRIAALIILAIVVTVVGPLIGFSEVIAPGTGINLQLSGPVTPMTPFTLQINQKGGAAQTSLALDPALMFADTLPANMTAVQYNAAAHTLTFSWDSGSPPNAAISLMTPSTAPQVVSAVSGSLSESLTITPEGASPFEVAAEPEPDTTAGPDSTDIDDAPAQ